MCRAEGTREAGWHHSTMDQYGYIAEAMTTKSVYTLGSSLKTSLCFSLERNFFTKFSLLDLLNGIMHLPFNLHGM